MDIVSSASITSAALTPAAKRSPAITTSSSNIIPTNASINILTNNTIIPSLGSSVTSTVTSTVTSNVNANSQSSSALNPQFNLRTGAVSISGLNTNNVSKAQVGINSVREPHKSQHPVSQDMSLDPFNRTAPESSISEDEGDSEIPAIFGHNNQPLGEVNVEDSKSSNPPVDDKSENEKAQQQKQIQEQDNIKKQEAIELQVINELKDRDIEVKTHEQAHAAVGGSFAQSPTFTYEKGPDGKRYAVEGEVSIDVGAIEGDPQATYNKMQKVYAAAMAPVQPSSADIRVAAEATQKMNEAKQELVLERQEKVINTDDVKHINDLGQIFNLASINEDLNLNLESINDNPLSASSDYQPINIAV